MTHPILNYLGNLPSVGDIFEHGGILRLACIERYMDHDMLERYHQAFVGLEKAGFIRYQVCLNDEGPVPEVRDEVFLGPTETTREAIAAYEACDPYRLLYLDEALF